MGYYLITRALQTLVSMLAVTAIVFSVANVIGDPLSAFLPEEASPEMVQMHRERLGLDRPLPVRYATYVADIGTGDFGQSIRTRRDVGSMIWERVPATLQLGGAALFLSMLFGIPLGIYAGYWRGGWLDRSARFMAVVGQSAPPFWVGILLILFFAVQLGVLPTGGRGTWAHLALPAAALAWANVAGVTRLMRSSLLETLETDYIRFCRIKGLSERRVLWKHGARNAALPVLTFGGVLAANLVTGSIVTEVVFSWPGMGRMLIEAVGARDYPVVQGVILVLAGMYVLVAFLVDALYAYINPRMRSA